MSAFTFRPQVEQLDGRCLPSANPTISIGDAFVTEGDSGQTALVFTVSLSKASSREVSVNYATADDQGLWISAIAGSDYVPTAGKLTFAPGETTKTITVLVNGETDYEDDEHFFVDLSSARGAKIADATGYGLILNDDLPPDYGDGGGPAPFGDYGGSIYY
jgi:hypothetical protein